MMKRGLLIVLGSFALLFGACGVVLPILPTTPFVILAAICYSMSSPKLASWLEKQPYFGEFITNYREKTGVRRQVKYQALIWLWLALIISISLNQSWHVQLFLSIVGLAVTGHILSLKTKINN